MIEEDLIAIVARAETGIGLEGIRTIFRSRIGIRSSRKKGRSHISILEAFGEFHEFRHAAHDVASAFFGGTHGTCAPLSALVRNGGQFGRYGYIDGKGEIII